METLALLLTDTTISADEVNARLTRLRADAARELEAYERELFRKRLTGLRGAGYPHSLAKGVR